MSRERRGEERSWIPITWWKGRVERESRRLGQIDWVWERQRWTRWVKERDVWLVQTNQKERQRDAGGLQSNPGLSQAPALITLEQSENSTTAWWPSLTPFHSTGSDQIIWAELCCPLRGNTRYKPTFATPSSPSARINCCTWWFPLVSSLYVRLCWLSPHWGFTFNKQIWGR